MINFKLKDSFNREINYLRVSVTDRCNLQCNYCMPEKIKFKERNEILTLEEIEKIINVGVSLGINKIRITGGEPLLRKNLIFLIKNLNHNSLIKEISITTNAILLKNYALELKESGIKRINISLDTLNGSKFSKITGGGNLKQVLAGINEAIKVGLSPLKINVVVMKGINDDEILNFIDFAEKNKVIIRFIEYMPLNLQANWKQKFFSAENILKIIEKKIINTTSFYNKNNEPAKYFKLKNSNNVVGIISPISHGFCNNCNRLRLTADGFLRSCLPLNIEFNVKKILRCNGSNNDLAEIFKIAVASKPKEGEYTKVNTNKIMAQIGG